MASAFSVKLNDKSSFFSQASLMKRIGPSSLKVISSILVNNDWTYLVYWLGKAFNTKMATQSHYFTLIWSSWSTRSLTSIRNCLMLDFGLIFVLKRQLRRLCFLEWLCDTKASLKIVQILNGSWVVNLMSTNKFKWIDMIRMVVVLYLPLISSFVYLEMGLGALMTYFCRFSRLKICSSMKLQML